MGGAEEHDDITNTYLNRKEVVFGEMKEFQKLKVCQMCSLVDRGVALGLLDLKGKCARTRWVLTGRGARIRRNRIRRRIS